jgi:hypothetical protein
VQIYGNANHFIHKTKNHPDIIGMVNIFEIYLF